MRGVTGREVSVIGFTRDSLGVSRVPSLSRGCRGTSARRVSRRRRNACRNVFVIVSRIALRLLHRIGVGAS